MDEWADAVGEPSRNQGETLEKHAARIGAAMIQSENNFIITAELITGRRIDHDANMPLPPVVPRRRSM